MESSFLLYSTKPALMLVAFFLCIVARVEASPILWTLSNVNFSDGSSVNGYFVFDAEAGSPPTGLTNYKISVSGGSLLPDFVYEPANSLSQLLVYSFPSTTGPQEVINAFRGRPPSGTAFELLYLDPISFLSSAGGNIPLDLVKSSAQLSNGEITYARSVLSSGSFIGVPEANAPEPASLLMIPFGMVLFAIGKYRRD